MHKEIDLDEILNQIWKCQSAYKSIVISKLLEEALLRSNKYVDFSSLEDMTLFGLPCKTSEDLDFVDYQLLRFNISDIK